MRDLDFETDGAVRHESAALPILPHIEAALAHVPPDCAGIRLSGVPGLGEWLCEGPIHAVAAARLRNAARPVRALLFDKTPATNWALGWHQDRTIVVRERRDMAGFGHWTRKTGLDHVEPPFAIIEGMMTLRIHLDDVTADNAPLLIAPGSHRLGRIPAWKVNETAARLGSAACFAMRGDIWAYATSILHASEAAAAPTHRRVLQVDYSNVDLPNPLLWLGI